MFLVVRVIKKCGVDPDFLLDLGKHQEPQRINPLKVRLELPLLISGVKAGTKGVEHDSLLFLE